MFVFITIINISFRKYCLLCITTTLSDYSENVGARNVQIPLHQIQHESGWLVEMFLQFWCTPHALEKMRTYEVIFGIVAIAICSTFYLFHYLVPLSCFYLFHYLILTRAKNLEFTSRWNKNRPKYQAIQTFNQNLVPL